MTAAMRNRRFSSTIVIDDNPIQRCHLAAVCREIGIPVVHEAACGSDGLELLARLKPRPQLLVVDLEMPGMDGVELLQHVQESNPEISIVVVSCHEQALLDTVRSMADALGLRVLAALPKPLAPSALIRALSAQITIRKVPPDGDSCAEDAPGVTSLLRAIERGEIFVHYQPKVDMHTGDVCGVEALARWNIAGIGLIPPERFIAMAEREGLIGELTLLVMRQAFAQAVLWNQEGLHLPLAVNFSPILLGRSAIVNDIVALASQYDLAPEQITLELTEGSLATGLGATLCSLTRLRIKGFGLSIDDYGTGFSTMHQVAHLPFTELKIDRSFVRGAHDRHNFRVILQSALNMARQLNLTSVAEGIETVEDLRLLQDMGCAMGQGWYFSKALAPDDLAIWVRSHQRRRGHRRGCAPKSAAMIA
jgi:EAL domain-containing protein (putative c-di-GMP-specific phosphodiesterase class I)/DNA-binding NarL/FixJ family response regulator